MAISTYTLVLRVVVMCAVLLSTTSSEKEIGKSCSLVAEGSICCLKIVARKTGDTTSMTCSQKNQDNKVWLLVSLDIRCSINVVSWMNMDIVVYFWYAALVVLWGSRK